MPVFRLVKPVDGQAQFIQENVKRITDWLASLPAVDGLLVGPFALSTTVFNVPHGLPHVPRGWFVADIDASATVYRFGAATALFLPLKASGNVNAKLWVW